jgi:hypothetical protein
VLNIRKNGILCQAKKATRYARYEGKFYQVLKITITERNLALWSKSAGQKLQGKLIYFICQNILRRGKGKERRNKKGGGKNNLTRHGQLFYG